MAVDKFPNEEKRILQATHEAGNPAEPRAGGESLFRRSARRSPEKGDSDG